MATPEAAVEVTTAAPDARPSQAFLPLVVAVMVAVLAAVVLLIGASFFLLKTGRLTLPAPSQDIAKAAASVPEEVAATHAMTLEPMVANLADADGKAFLRIGLTLRIFDGASKKDEKAKEEKPKEAKGPNEAEAAVRDISLEVLGGQTSELLLAADGKESLKTALKLALAKRDPSLKVADIFFTEFLVQR
jgi:flagellar FliL protein